MLFLEMFPSGVDMLVPLKVCPRLLPLVLVFLVEFPAVQHGVGGTPLVLAKAAILSNNSCIFSV